VITSVVALVDRGDTLFDMRFAKTGQAKFAMEQTHVAGATPEDGAATPDSKRPRISRGGPGSNTMARSPLFDPESRGGAADVVNTSAPSGTMAWRAIDFGHLATEAAKARFDSLAECDRRAGVCVLTDRPPFRA